LFQQKNCEKSSSEVIPIPPIIIDSKIYKIKSMIWGHDPKRGVQDNYGFFFPLYVQHIMNNDLDGIYNEALIKIDSDCELSKESKSIVERSKSIYAGVLVAGWLCEEVFKKIGLPHRSREEVERIVNRYFKECVIGEPVEADWIRALRLINDWVITEDQKFEDYGKGLKYGTYGKISSEFIDIVGTAFTKKMKENEFSPTKIKQDLLENDITVCTSSRKDGNYNVKVNNKLAAGIRIKREAMKEVLQLKEETIDWNQNILDMVKLLSRINKAADLSILKSIFGNDVEDNLIMLEHEGNVKERGTGRYV
jgi:putative DNA primase/helicase